MLLGEFSVLPYTSRNGEREAGKEEAGRYQFWNTVRLTVLLKSASLSPWKTLLPAGDWETSDRQVYSTDRAPESQASEL